VPTIINTALGPSLPTGSHLLVRADRIASARPRRPDRICSSASIQP